MRIIVLTEMSSLLNTGLDREALSICVSLCESGVNPEALAVCPHHPFDFAIPALQHEHHILNCATLFSSSVLKRVHIVNAVILVIKAVIKELRRESASVRVSGRNQESSITVKIWIDVVTDQSFCRTRVGYQWVIEEPPVLLVILRVSRTE